MFLLLIFLIIIKSQLSREMKRGVMMDLASHRAVKAVKKTRKDFGQNVHSGRPACPPHCPDK